MRELRGRRKDREEMKIEDDICQLVAMQSWRERVEGDFKLGKAWITEYY